MDNFGPPLFIIIPFAIVFIIIFSLAIYGIIHSIRMQRRLMANGGVITRTVVGTGGGVFQESVVVVSPPRTAQNHTYVPYGANQSTVPCGATQGSVPYDPQSNAPLGTQGTTPFNNANHMGAPPAYTESHSISAGTSQHNFHAGSANNVGQFGDIEKGYDR